MGWLTDLARTFARHIEFDTPAKQLDSFSMLPGQFVVLGLETTGLSSHLDEIIEVGAIRITLEESRHPSFQALVKTVRKIPRKITGATGITQEMVDQEGEELELVLKKLVELIGDLRLVIFNADFTMDFLERAAGSHGISINNPVSCVLDMTRRAWPELESYKISDLESFGELPTTGKTHRVLRDCELTLHTYLAAALELESME